MDRLDLLLGGSSKHVGQRASPGHSEVEVSLERALRPTLGANLSAKKDSDEASGLVSRHVERVGLSGFEPLTSALSGRACGPTEWAGGRSGCPGVSSDGLLNRSQLSPS